MHSQREAYMPEAPARKSFEAGARTAREAADTGTAAAEQATRQAEQSYASIADGIREFNTKLLDIAQANTLALGLEQDSPLGPLPLPNLAVGSAA
jgi:hypothetical protein